MTTKQTPAGSVAAPPRADRHVGSSATRVDSHAKVTGASVYSTDYYPRDVLHAKILFSDRPRARIVSIDTSAAEALPGVKAVLTGNDVPDHRYGLYVHDRTILAKDQVRYVGEHVAAVAAVTERIAAKAVSLIEVAYEDLESVPDPQTALTADAPRLHPEVADYSAAHPYIKYDNIAMEASLEQGDVDAAMAAADVVVEATYKTPAINHAAIEPHACVAGYDPRGRLTVWTATQQLSVCHSALAMALGVPMTQIRVIPLELGGGFGGKLHTNLEPLAAALAEATGQHVRLAMTREEEFFAAKGRAPYTIHLRYGATRDGKLVAGDADIVCDLGAYADEAIGTASHALASADGCYRFPALRGRSRAVYTNNPDHGCMRGYGTYQITYAIERHMDALAVELDMDPAEIRLINLISDGDPIITGQPVRVVRVRETMEQALERSGYWDKKGNLEPNQGIGIVNVSKTNGLLSSSATIRLNEDGTFMITTAAVEIGTGTHTVLPQIAAEVLDVAVDRITVAAPDSETTSFDLGSIASRTVFDAGNSVRLAAEDLAEQIVLRAGELLDCPPDEIELKNGRAFRRGDSDGGLDYGAVAGISLYSHGGPLLGTAAVNQSKPFATQPGKGFVEGYYPSFAFGTHVAEVEVDPDTGETTVLNYTACHDVGRAINPMGTEGQIEGGVGQGLGAGLWEELRISDGTIRNPNFVDYQLPTILDTPPIDVSLVEIPDPRGPFGAKGVGEHPILGPGPAVANAIGDAVGVHVSEIPVTPERLYRLMHG